MCTSHHSETYSCEGELTTHSIGKAAEQRANKANKSPVAEQAVEDYFLPALFVVEVVKPAPRNPRPDDLPVQPTRSRVEQVKSNG